MKVLGLSSVEQRPTASAAAGSADAEQTAARRTRRPVVRASLPPASSRRSPTTEIALFFTGHKHAGENLLDLLERRSPRAGSADPDVRCPVAQPAGGTEDPPGPLSGPRPTEVRGRGRELPARVPACPGDPEGSSTPTTRSPGTGGCRPQERLRFHQAQSGPAMADLEAWMDGADRAEEGGAQQRPGRGHRLHAQALEGTDPVPAGARSPAGQQHLRTSPQEGRSFTARTPTSTRPRTAPASATCS